MKKDIRWLKEEIPNLRGYVVIIDDEIGELEPVITVSMEDVYRIIGQLDEPETDQHSYKKGFLDGQKDQRQHFKHISKNQDTLSQKWIDKHKYFAEEKIGEDAVVKARDLRKLLVPKQDLPVIPQFVAEWIEDYKEREDIYTAISNAFEGMESAEMYNWVSGYTGVANQETFARAWLDGYEVEEEQKYRVLDGNTTLLGRINGLMLTTVEILEYYPEYAPTFEFTEQEIKDYDPRYMTFAKPVEENEE